jgi:sugar lactone lactonase YvrE
MAGSEPINVWDVGTELGEGPVWVERDRALWFTDIKRQKIHRFDPESGEKRSWSAPEQVGFVLPAAGGGFVAGLMSGLHRFNETTGEFELIAQVDAHLPENRLNDGAVDPSGRVWFGTMDNSENSKSGSFYRFENGRVLPTGLTGIAITNGPALSPDGRILYWIDTLERRMDACDVTDDGSLGPSRPLVRFGPGEGNPDGPAVDSEGCIWVGMYGGWHALRYSPQGELIERVRLPTANVTKIAFGGPDLRTAYATTARHLLSREELERQPQAGGLFSFQVDVPGIPCPLVAL